MDKPIVSPSIERYLEDLAPARDAVLARMEELAAHTGFPIVGPLVGQLLFTLARSCGARRVFEMGSGYGYSTVWFARAVGDGGLVVHTEVGAETSRQARKFLGEAGLAGRVRFEIGDAREILARDAGPYDLVFCDIDKDGYPEVPDLAVPRLRPGGLLVFDNVLWHGEVVAPSDERARAVVELNRGLSARDDLATAIVPLRDGVSISVKL
ncbi:MAG: O-methyltransferase [Acidobacteria bacterium]|nr:O-methyltransferase [Acidobacteriota bacterium]